MPATPVTNLQEVRLALCSVGELFGGVERQLLGLCAYWRRQGAEPLLILFHERELAAQARRQGVEPVVLGARHSYDTATAGHLAGLLAERRINVVHVHGYRATVNCALARRKIRFALVKTEHGLPEPADRSPVRWLKSRIYRRLETWATRRTGAVVCYVTDDIRRRCRRRHAGLERFTVYNGIDPLDPTAFSRPPELEPELFHLVLAGRLTAVKGIETAIAALQIAPSRVRLNILGTGPARAVLERSAARSGLGERVRFLGFRHDVLDFLCHGDLLLMPSLHEGLPYTLLEAMSLARPIVAAQVGGLAEILQHERTALLFQPGDVRALADCVKRLCDDRELGRTLGAAARDDQTERLTLNAMGDRYLQVYRGAAAGEVNHGR